MCHNIDFCIDYDPRGSTNIYRRHEEKTLASTEGDGREKNLQG
jgi:hypothetical protein